MKTHLFTHTLRLLYKILSLVLPTDVYPPQTKYSLILYLSNDKYDQKMHYLCSLDI